MQSTSTAQSLTSKFCEYKESQFTGILHIGTNQKAQWSIYFHMGRMVWARARTHPTRRWYRQIQKHCPHLLENFDQDYSKIHYTKLVAKVRSGELNRINLAKAVEDYLSEILFDIVHQGTLRDLQSKPSFTLTDISKRYASAMFLIVRAEQAWQQSQYDWRAWQQAGLVKCSPNLAPRIGDAEALRRNTSTAVYEHLTNVIDGAHSFRDLSVQLDQPLLPMTRRIVPYVRQGLMGLVRLSNIESKEARTAQKPSATVQQPALEASKQKLASIELAQQRRQGKLEHRQSHSPSRRQNRSMSAIAAEPSRSLPRKTTKTASNAPLVIYIDDSPSDSRKMGSILQDAGYRFRSIQESTHALPLLIEHKPQLIFLDLVMPVANGYEICSQVRRVSLFKDIPIVIVTSNNSLADRVHAKVVGASGFLSKPIDRDRVLKTVRKLLETSTQSRIQRKLERASSQSNIEQARSLRELAQM